MPTYDHFLTEQEEDFERGGKPCKRRKRYEMETFLLGAEKSKTIIKCPHEVGSFDYIDRIERVKGSPVLFVRKSRLRLLPHYPPPGGVRGDVLSLSRRSWLRMVEHAIRWPHKMRGFITLTYHNVWPETSAESKLQLKAMLRWIRDQGAVHNFWCLEFQDRAAPHYHIWTDVLVHDTSLLARWREITGDDTIVYCESRPLKKTIAHYIAKEASKRFQKVAPMGWPPGRMWGHSQAKLLPLESVTVPDGLTAHCMTILFKPPLAFNPRPESTTKPE
jgi:hypothetical protein